MEINLEPVWTTWSWTAEALRKPEILSLLLIFFLLMATACAVPVLLKKQLTEFSRDVYANYNGKFKNKGLKQDTLELIVRCLAWVFAIKLCSELLEPIIVTFLPIANDEFNGIPIYDWIMIVAVSLLVGTFWLRFLFAVKRHDETKTNSKIDRSLSRAHPMFWKPAALLLILLFLPDFGKRATSFAAYSAKAAGIPPIKLSTKSATEHRLARATAP